MRFSGRSDAFAKRVESDRDALAIDGLRNAQRIFRLHACDEPRVEASAERGVLKEAAKRTIMRERDEGGTKNWHDSPLLEGARKAHWADKLVSHMEMKKCGPDNTLV
jgi:hypothetical protein